MPAMKLSDPVRERIFAPSYDPPSDSSRSPTPNPANEGKGVEARQAGVGSPGPNTMAGKAARFSYGLAGLHAQSPLRSSTPFGVSSRSSSLEQPPHKGNSPGPRQASMGSPRSEAASFSYGLANLPAQPLVKKGKAPQQPREQLPHTRSGSGGSQGHKVDVHIKRPFETADRRILLNGQYAASYIFDINKHFIFDQVQQVYT